LFPALHAPLPYTTLLARGYVYYWKRRSSLVWFLHVLWQALKRAEPRQLHKMIIKWRVCFCLASDLYFCPDLVTCRKAFCECSRFSLASTLCPEDNITSVTNVLSTSD